MNFLDELEKCTRGRILLAQIARAIEQADTPELNAMLKDYLQRCLVRSTSSQLVRNGDGSLDVTSSLVAPIIFAEPRVWFFADKGSLVRRHRLATLVEATTFQFLTGTESGTSSELNARDVANTTSRDFEGAKLGPTPRAEKRNIFWATRYDRARQIAPALDGLGPLPPEQAKQLRDYLGLSHIGSRDAVLLVLEATAAETHTGDVSRPFLFDGMDNRCFHIFDRKQELEGWNRALNLAHLEDATVWAEGGPEVVLSSMPATQIERCIFIGRPPAAETNDANLLSFMLNGSSTTTAQNSVKRFMGW